MRTPEAPARVARAESLDQEGRGVARVDGKAIFISGALPGELVEYSPYQRKPTYELAQAVRVLEPSPARVDPRCVHFGVCGGCSHQHMEPRAQVAAKQRVLEDALARIGRVQPQQWLAPIHGPDWEYRHRARLSVRYVHKKARLLLGFHERRSSFVADMHACEVLPARISALIEPLRQLIDGLSIRERVPQVEVAVGDAVDVLVLRILEPLAPADEGRLREFADRHGICFFLQRRGPDSAEPFHPPAAPALRYRLPDFDLAVGFSPTDFTQVNHEVNRVLVRRAVALLDPRPGERVADMFCGLGNFSLAIARRGARVLGIEGNARLTARARDNAVLNGLGALCEFAEADLFSFAAADWNRIAPFDGVLIDPPRDGAVELVKSLAGAPPARIVYVSCSPATLARDAAVLVHVHGYRLASAGVVNMFPHTSHVESMALFER
ncbi:MAG TPA: 23S rRNA (uracil(1939)-C(5))-methyltransferase RlmD [Burkholderiales bacterium]|nr:23S rRNA (uracil(1939)-C(5))-methyltransferase RlmD [Burkholderiales bacterium]